MVGGVIESINFGKNISIATVRGTGCEQKDTCKVKIKTVFWIFQITKGDEIWWQAGKIYWTPKNPQVITAFKKLGKKIEDIVFHKVGNSY